MKNKRTEAVLILDKSGSMNSIRDDTIGSVESFIADQKALKGAGSLRLTIVEFNSEVHTRITRMNIKDVHDKFHNYIPHGTTALLDAIGATVTSTEKRLKDKKKDRNVVFVIMTDGKENSSREYSNDDIKSIIERKQDDGWDFIFLGANQDAFATAGSFGIATAMAANFDHTGRGVRSAYASSSAFLAKTRHGKDAKDSWRIDELEEQQEK